MSDFFTPLAFVLSLGVVFVNGFTDAPSAIATSVGSGAISIKKASLIGAIFNFLGVVVSSLLFPSLSRLVFSFGSFGKSSPLGLCAVLLTVIIFALICLKFSLPSSESHALICGILGASFALNSAQSLKMVGEVFVFLIISWIFALCSSYIVGYGISKRLPKKHLQITACALNSLMHGWQDGQKLIGIIFTLFIAKGDDFSLPLYLILAVGGILAIGSFVGSGKIVKSLGFDIVPLSYDSAISAELGTYFTLLVFSIAGAPVSTGNIKSLATVGAGLFDKRKINFKMVFKLIFVSLITFPACFLISYALTLLFKLF